MKPLLIFILKFIVVAICSIIMMPLFFLIAFMLWDRRFLHIYNTTMNTIFNLDDE